MEETKFGLDLEEARQLLDSDTFKQMQNVRICGVMGMATFTDDMAEVRKEFKHLKEIFCRPAAVYGDFHGHVG